MSASISAFLSAGRLWIFATRSPKPVIEVHAEFLDDGGVLGDEVLEEDFYGMAEHDGVGDLHHRGLEMDGEEDISLSRFGDLFFEKGDEGLLVHDRAVNNFTGFEGSLLF